MAVVGAAELVIIAAVLLVLVVGIAGAAIALFVVLSKSKSQTGAPAGIPTANPYQPAAPPAAKPAQGAKRMLAAPDYTFAKIERSMAQCDLALQGTPGPVVAPNEPSSAVFSDGKHKVTYRYDAAHGLRMIEIVGPNPKYVLNDLLNLAYMPSLEGYKVSSLLASANPVELLRGIFAAEFIGADGDQKYYIEPVGKLVQHPDPTVRQEAQRVYALLSMR